MNEIKIVRLLNCQASNNLNNAFERTGKNEENFMRVNRYDDIHRCGIRCVIIGAEKNEYVREQFHGNRNDEFSC